MHLMPRNLMITFGLSIIICWVVRLKYRGTICNDVGVVVYIHRHVYIDFHRDNDNDDDDNGAFSANGLVCQCPCSLFLYLMKCHLASQRPLSSVLPVSLWRFSTLFTYYFVFDCHSACRSILNTYVATALAKIPYSRWIKCIFFPVSHHQIQIQKILLQHSVKLPWTKAISRSRWPSGMKRCLLEMKLYPVCKKKSAC